MTLNFPIVVLSPVKDPVECFVCFIYSYKYIYLLFYCFPVDCIYHVGVHFTSNSSLYYAVSLL